MEPQEKAISLARCAQRTSVWVLSVVCLLCADSGAALEATALLQGDPKRSRVPAVDMLWLSHYPSGRLQKLTQERVGFADFSADGRYIAYTMKDSLFIVNNDGTEARAHFKGAPASFRWTTNGIMWIANDTLRRYLPETRQFLKHPMGLREDTKEHCAGGKYTMGADMSRDGMRMWTYDGFNPTFVDSLYCGVRGYDRGGHPYMQWAPGFTSRSTIWRSEWGHGNAMTADGHLILVQLGAHRRLGITRQEGMELRTIHPYYNYDPPYPNGMESRPVPVAVNNDSIIGSRAKYTKNAPDAICRTNEDCPPGTHYYFYNWRTSRVLGKFRVPDSLSDDGIHSFVFWYGPLPRPGGAQPRITLTPEKIDFTVETGQTPPARQVQIVNTGAGDLTLVKLSVAASRGTAGTAWLQATAPGTGGNAQTVDIKILPDKMASDEVHAVITVTATGASNTATIAVSAYRGNSLPPPGGVLAVPAGDSLTDARITWKDNSQGESGFLIERRRVGPPEKESDWSTAGRAGADRSEYVDRSLDIGTYRYRVRALSGERPSSASSEAEVSIQGVPWIRITRPGTDFEVRPGVTDTLLFTANQVEQVIVELSLDDGGTWNMLTLQGGLFSSHPHWGRFPWNVPDTETDSARLRVTDYFEPTSAFTPRFKISRLAASIRGAESEYRLGIGHIHVSGTLLRLQGAIDHSTFFALADMRGRVLRSWHLAPGEGRTESLADLPRGLYRIGSRGADGRGRTWAYP